MSKEKKIIIGFIILLLIGSGCAALSFCVLFKQPFLNGHTTSLHIRPQTTFDQVCDSLRQNASEFSVKIFRWSCQYKGYDQKLYSGYYEFPGDASLYEVFTTLTRGKQTPVTVTFNNVRTIPQLAGRLSEELMADSTEFLSLLTDSVKLQQWGYTLETIPAMFLPNTYEVYWTTTPLRFLERMQTEYTRFWNPSRIDKALKLGITPLQASIIASMAEEETNKKEELGMVCGLYYNRLKRNMPMQADPTIKFALKQFDLNRILLKQLEIDSPYNTYKYAGLPPGPIRIPETGTIDALLNHTPHDYLYMCAKEDFSGTHRFTKSLSEHNRNAAKYQAELNRRKIYK